MDDRLRKATGGGDAIAFQSSWRLPPGNERISREGTHMLARRKAVIVAGGLAVFAIAGAVLAYSAYRRAEAVDTSATPELLSAVPAGAPTLVYADLAAIRASAFYQH